jgi:hypothetical protein
MGNLILCGLWLALYSRFVYRAWGKKASVTLLWNQCGLFCASKSAKSDSCVLLQQYPFDIPTEAFSFEIFKQAFVAVQSCVVHLQGVSLARRFALVPLGPPLLAYKSNCKAMLKAVGDFVQLEVDRPYHAGEPIVVWYVLHFYCMTVCTATYGSGCLLKQIMAACQ